MRPFAYARPQTVDEAFALLDEHGPGAHILAGGTDLMIGLRHGAINPGIVVDIKRVAELKSEIRENEGALRISSNAVLTDVIGDDRVQRHFPALAEAAATVGSVAIRNRATVVGNICNASPAADTAPALLVYGAEIELMSRAGTRHVLLDDFFVGPGQTEIQLGEIVTAISLPIPTQPVGVAFGRMTRRRGVDLATINLCCRVNSDGVTTFAYGAVGPRPFLVGDETGVLADRGANEQDRDAVLLEMTGHASPITDVRASAEYRQAMLEVLSRRALQVASDRLAAA